MTRWNLKVRAICKTDANHKPVERRGETRILTDMMKVMNVGEGEIQKQGEGMTTQETGAGIKYYL